MLGVIGALLFGYWLLNLDFSGPPAKLVNYRQVEYKSILYVMDSDTKACTLYYQWYDKEGMHRENTQVVIPLAECPKKVQVRMTA